AGSTMPDVAMAALAEAQREFNGDRTRIYLTGLSMGGYGSWYLAGKYPGKFAAIAPICGGILMPDMARMQPPDDNSPYLEAAKKIGKTPVWIFHGGDDPVVPVTYQTRKAARHRRTGNPVAQTACGCRTRVDAPQNAALKSAVCRSGSHHRTRHQQRHARSPA